MDPDPEPVPKFHGSATLEKSIASLHLPRIYAHHFQALWTVCNSAINKIIYIKITFVSKKYFKYVYIKNFAVKNLFTQ